MKDILLEMISIEWASKYHCFIDTVLKMELGLYT